ncbi:hypothetical protein G7K_6681-t1 [Saitoella complicata NRRL Y-17804]|uniref:ATP-dependent RNA helicase n=2 Tax=Saitoella complicata (strain BCRC 22490 / CBS 7301 / JCM 7358 / NBRC 10748 / NRRL Y-17804) TaxID=698492 RepID=A0A0E9NS61_SAICN|nr:hypothetical protein G7K_6681-t1 [Saitoella complicata NRRL Y-17804]
MDNGTKGMSRAGRGGSRGFSRGGARGGARKVSQAGVAPPEKRPRMDIATPESMSQFSTAPTTPAEPSSATPLFQDLADQGVLKPNLLQAIHNNLKYKTMTEVQAATMGSILEGKDCLAQAKTGTGKTLAFLIPAIQTLMGRPPTKKSIRAIIVSPTRELAKQITDEARLLMTGFNFRSHTSIGGLSTSKDQKAVLTCPDLLIATPGRLHDHLSNPSLKACFTEVQFFVLDEADQLLDQGFSVALNKIMALLPPTPKRQTLLFSATVPNTIKQLAGKLLRPGYALINTINETDVGTHERIPQFLIHVPSVNTVLPSLLALIRAEQASTDKFKAVIFLPTAYQTKLFAEHFTHIGSTLTPFLPTYEIHSRLSQSKREKTADEFRAAKTGVLFSSDVSARGMDFPDVTHVIQVGQPSNREQYIHRLGRTGRAGKSGKGFLILAPYEAAYLTQIKDLPLAPHTLAPTSTDFEVSNSAMSRVPEQTKNRAYSAWLGFYKQQKGALKPQALVQMANEMACGKGGFGLKLPPLMWTQTVGKMGLKGVEGLRLTKVKPGSD